MTITTPKRLGALGGLRHRHAAPAPAHRRPRAPRARHRAPPRERPGIRGHDLPVARVPVLRRHLCTGRPRIDRLRQLDRRTGDRDGARLDDHVPDLPLSITAPGEESGTFDSFVELVLEGPAEARSIPEDQWTTRPDYTSSPNDNSIVSGVSDSAGSLGWVGFAFYEENLDTLRAFDIAEEAGGTCVTPDATTIASNEYPVHATCTSTSTRPRPPPTRPSSPTSTSTSLTGRSIRSSRRFRTSRSGPRWPRARPPGSPVRPARQRIQAARSSSVARPPSSRSPLVSRRPSRPPTPASTTRSRAPAPVTASPSSATVRRTSRMRPARSAKRRSPPAPPVGSSTWS